MKLRKIILLSTMVVSTAMYLNLNVANAQSKSFKVIAIKYSDSIKDLSIKYDTQYGCSQSSTGIDCHRDRSEMSGIIAEKIDKVLPVLSWNDLDPAYHNIVALGYYNKATKETTYPPGCEIDINSFPNATATISITQSACVIS